MLHHPRADRHWVGTSTNAEYVADEARMKVSFSSDVFISLSSFHEMSPVLSTCIRQNLAHVVALFELTLLAFEPRFTCYLSGNDGLKS